MNDKYSESPSTGGVLSEFQIYLEILGQINGLEFEVGELEEKLKGMTDRSLAQRVLDWGRKKGIIEMDSVRMVYYVDIGLAYGDVETHPEYFGIKD